MRMATLAAKNTLRNPVRLVLTLLAVTVTVLAFMSLRTVLTAWNAGADAAAKDRVATRHKITFIMPLPKNYVAKVRANKDLQGRPLGVTDVTWANWFGGKSPAHEQEFFATIAVDPESFLRVYDEIVVPEDQKTAWLATRRGALVGDVLARKLGWKVGDTVTLESTIFPGTWDFEVSGIYEATRKSVDRSTFWFHWEYMNEGIEDGPDKDKIGWMISRIDNPARSAEISKNIDQLFDEASDQTLSMSERQLAMSFMAGFSAVLTAIDIVSLVILAIMALILGNAIAMGVRERTNEYGVLRAIGFLPRHLVVFIMAESMFVGLFGGLVGTGLGYAMINFGAGPGLEENMGGIFPYFRVETSTVLWSIALSAALGLAAAALPALRASKLQVVNAIRRVG